MRREIWLASMYWLPEIHSKLEIVGRAGISAAGLRRVGDVLWLVRVSMGLGRRVIQLQSRLTFVMASPKY